MKIRHLIVIFIVLFFPINCFAKCEIEHLNEAKKFASNVNFSYYAYFENNEAKFNIVVNNLFEPVVLINDLTEERYDFTEENNGEIIFTGLKSGDYKYRIHSDYFDCVGNKLLEKTIKLPYYNQYYLNDACKGKENYYLCQKWIDKPVSYDEFIEKVNSYEVNKNETIIEQKEEMKTFLEILLSIYTNYYWAILGGIIIFAVSLIIILNKKDQLV